VNPLFILIVQTHIIDAFVNFFIGTQKKKSKIKKKTLNPQWNEKIETFKSFDLIHPLKVAFKVNNLLAKNERIGVAYCKLEQLPLNYTITKKLTVYNEDEKPTGNVWLQLEAVNFGINARMYLAHSNVSRYIKAFHSDSDPMIQTIVLRHNGQFFSGLEEALVGMKAILHRDPTIDPTIILFPGDYMLKDTFDLDVKDLILYGVPVAGSQSGATSSGTVNLISFNKNKQLFNIKRQSFLHKLNILGAMNVEMTRAEEICHIDSCHFALPVIRRSDHNLKYTNYDFGNAEDQQIEDSL
jgi:hypothetical protein